MKCVYILESETGDHYYVGITDDVPARFRARNAGHVAHLNSGRGSSGSASHSPTEVGRWHSNAI
jgi:predicted GIY-YIG superfamily endonuclease